MDQTNLLGPGAYKLPDEQVKKHGIKFSKSSRDKANRGFDIGPG